MHLFLFVLYEGKNTFCEIAAVSHRGVLLATEITEEQITVQGECLKHCAWTLETLTVPSPSLALTMPLSASEFYVGNII